MISRALALLVVVGSAFGIAWLSSTSAHSQLSFGKGAVALQSVSPGFSQSGHANISGTMQSGQFVGGGSGLTNLNASSIASGTLSADRLPGVVARTDTTNAFTQLTRFDDFVGIGTSTPFSGADRFRIANGPSQTSYVGMYISSNLSTGLPFYGYVANSAIAWTFLDSAGNWQLVNNGQVPVLVNSAGNVGLGNTLPTERLEVAGNAKVSGYVTAEAYKIPTQRKYRMIPFTHFESHAVLGTPNIGGRTSNNYPVATNVNTLVPYSVGVSRLNPASLLVSGMNIRGSVVASLDLPHGAVLQNADLKLFVYNQSPSPLVAEPIISVYRIPIMSTGSNATDGWELVMNQTLPLTSIPVSTYQTISGALIPHVVDAEEYTYCVSVSLSANSSSGGNFIGGLTALRIGYDIDRVD